MSGQLPKNQQYQQWHNKPKGITMVSAGTGYQPWFTDQGQDAVGWIDDSGVAHECLLSMQSYSCATSP